MQRDALLLQEVIDAIERITALTEDFHGPAQLAFALGAAACVPLAALLWWRARWRQAAAGNGRTTDLQ